jgi:hypothetical protein
LKREDIYIFIAGLFIVNMKNSWIATSSLVH